MGVLELRNLTKVFKGKKGSNVIALNDVSLAVESGEVFGFLGPNGAGKSTTIKSLLGLIRPTNGKVFINGIDSQRSNARQCIGYLPENPAFYEYMTAEEYLLFVGGTFGISEGTLHEQVAFVLKRLDLWDVRKRQIRGYSKGMVQRVGLAQVLVHDPEIYILDEPMSGLDPLGRALVKEIILELKKRGKSVFFSTHITSDVESVCDRVGVIVKGDLKCVKKVEDITIGGITGYEIRYLKDGTSSSCAEVISENDLSAKLIALKSTGCTLLLVEPVRKSLEEFFVDIVHQS